MLEEFCERWKIAALETFEAGGLEDYELHMLVTFKPEAKWGLWEHSQMQEELSELLGRAVELVTRRAIETSRSAYLKESILGSARLVYSSR